MQTNEPEHDGMNDHRPSVNVPGMLLLCLYGTLWGAALVAPTSCGGPRPSGEVKDLGAVQAIVRNNNARIVFPPYPGAKDYRVYVMPKNADTVRVDGGAVAVKNALYRCAGEREVPSIPLDNEPQQANGAMRAIVNQSVHGFGRTAESATLGYVYRAPGPERNPVYALGDPAPNADNLCYQQRWQESRVKKYVTVEAERDRLLAAAWRDDGIAFWVPAGQGSGTKAVFTAIDDKARLYFTEGPEKVARSSLSIAPAFSVLTAQSSDTEPLMRVFYDNGCGASHDELVAGKARFERAARQGYQPMNELVWTNLTGPTRLVVEALDQGCPFQGHLSPKSIPAENGHQPYLSIEQIRAVAPYGEVFVNGQHNPANRPQAIARAYVDAAPQPRETMDFQDAFAAVGAIGPFKELPNAGFQSVHLDSPTYDVTFQNVEFPQWALGEMFGELWVTYADWAADTNGKFRLTPKQKATLSPASFVHVTMGVDLVTTGRRYPQILISDRDAPIQDVLSNGSTFIVQSFGDYPPRIDLQLCDHHSWDVNNQCPRFAAPPNLPIAPLAAHSELSEHIGVDRRAYFDVYLSTARAYLFLDGEPWACANLPATGGMPAGPVTVTFGDVLYHSGVDVEDPPFRFHRRYMFTETRRHFGDLGFRSGVPAPSWDEKRLPCDSTLVP